MIWEMLEATKKEETLEATEATETRLNILFIPTLLVKADLTEMLRMLSNTGNTEHI